MSKQNRLSIESVFRRIQDFNLNISGELVTRPFCNKKGNTYYHDDQGKWKTFNLPPKSTTLKGKLRAQVIYQGHNDTMSYKQDFLPNVNCPITSIIFQIVH